MLTMIWIPECVCDGEEIGNYLFTCVSLQYLVTLWHIYSETNVPKRGWKRAHMVKNSISPWHFSALLHSCPRLGNLSFSCTLRILTHDLTLGSHGKIKGRSGRIRSNFSCTTSVYSSTFRLIYMPSFASPNYIFQESNLMQITSHGTKPTTDQYCFDFTKNTSFNPIKNTSVTTSHQ